MIENFEELKKRLIDESIIHDSRVEKVSVYQHESKTYITYFFSGSGPVGSGWTKFVFIDVIKFDLFRYKTESSLDYVPCYKFFKTNSTVYYISLDIDESSSDILPSDYNVIIFKDIEISTITEDIASEQKRATKENFIPLSEALSGGYLIGARINRIDLYEENYIGVLRVGLKLNSVEHKDIEAELIFTKLKHLDVLYPYLEGILGEIVTCTVSQKNQGWNYCAMGTYFNKSSKEEKNYIEVEAETCSLYFPNSTLKCKT